MKRHIVGEKGAAKGDVKTYCGRTPNPSVRRRGEKGQWCQTCANAAPSGSTN